MTRAEKWKKWTAIVAAQVASGKNMTRWCQENKVGYTLFLYWKNQVTGQQRKK